MSCGMPYWARNWRKWWNRFYGEGVLWSSLLWPSSLGSSSTLNRYFDFCVSLFGYTGVSESPSNECFLPSTSCDAGPHDPLWNCAVSSTISISCILVKYRNNYRPHFYDCYTLGTFMVSSEWRVFTHSPSPGIPQMLTIYSMGVVSGLRT